MITRINIKGYKSFQDLKLELPSFGILLGLNNTGKSNLLDAIHLLSKTVTSRNLDEAFANHRGLPDESIHYGANGTPGKEQAKIIECTLQADVEIPHSIRETMVHLIRGKREGLDSQDQTKHFVFQRRMRYTLTIEILASAGHLRVIEERLIPIKMSGTEKKRNPYIERIADRLHLRPETPSHPIFCDIGLDQTIVSTPLYVPHYPHINAFRQELSGWQLYRFDHPKMTQLKTSRSGSHALAGDGENMISFLHFLKNEKREEFDELNVSLAQALSREVRIDVDIDTGLRLYDEGQWYSSRLMPDGIIKLIAIFASVSNSNPFSLVMIDDIESGLSHQSFDTLCKLLNKSVRQNGKQVMVATRSLALAGFVEDKHLFVLRKDGNQTSIVPVQTPGPMFRDQHLQSLTTNK